MTYQKYLSWFLVIATALVVALASQAMLPFSLTSWAQSGDRIRSQAAISPLPTPICTPGPQSPLPTPTRTPGPQSPLPTPTATPIGQSPLPVPTCTPGPQSPLPTPTHTPNSPLATPTASPTPTVTPTVTATDTPTDTPLPPTATTTETPVPPTATVIDTPTLLPTATETATPTAPPTATETAAPPTATPMIITIRVEGQVLDQATGAGIADVLMTLSNGTESTETTAAALAGQAYTTTTDLNGFYVFSAVKPGAYTLTGTKAGVVIAAPAPVTVSGDRAIQVPVLVVTPTQPKVYLPLVNRE